MVWKLSHGDSRARTSRSYIALVGVKLGGSSFGSSRLGDGALQEDLGILVLFVLDPYVKTRIV